jgi:hypothetical protein
MKKIIYSLVIFSFIFGLAAIPAVRAEDAAVNAIVTSSSTVSGTLVGNDRDAHGCIPSAGYSWCEVKQKCLRVWEEKCQLVNATGAEGLEKIPSPEQIKNFQAIKKIGNTLYGIKKEIKAEKALTATTSSSAATASKLEKISHPGVINLFEKIQKIGSTLWGIKKKATSTPLIITPEISACVATAINVKDKALMARVTSAATELNTALATRSACQQAAVAATTTPRDTLNACVKTFNEAHKTIKEASKKVQKDSWEIYKNSLKTCRTGTSTEAVPMVEDGGNIFE